MSPQLDAIATCESFESPSVEENSEQDFHDSDLISGDLANIDLASSTSNISDFGCSDDGLSQFGDDIEKEHRHSALPDPLRQLNYDASACQIGVRIQALINRADWLASEHAKDAEFQAILLAYLRTRVIGIDESYLRQRLLTNGCRLFRTIYHLKKTYQMGTVITNEPVINGKPLWEWFKNPRTLKKLADSPGGAGKFLACREIRTVMEIDELVGLFIQQEQEEEKAATQQWKDERRAECLCCFNEKARMYVFSCDAKDDCKNGNPKHLVCRDCLNRHAQATARCGYTTLVCIGSSHCIGIYSPELWFNFLNYDSVTALLRAGNAHITPLKPTVPVSRHLIQTHPDPTFEHARQLRLKSIRHEIEEAMSKAVIRQCQNCFCNGIKDSGCNAVRCPKCGWTRCYLCNEFTLGPDHYRGVFDTSGAPERHGQCKLVDSMTADEHREFEAGAAKEMMIKTIMSEHTGFTRQDILAVAGMEQSQISFRSYISSTYRPFNVELPKPRMVLCSLLPNEQADISSSASSTSGELESLKRDESETFTAGSSSKLQAAGSDDNLQRNLESLPEHAIEQNIEDEHMGFEILEVANTETGWVVINNN